MTAIVPPIFNGIVQRKDPSLDPSWDANLAAFPRATFFHTRAWARVLKETYGFRPVYFTFERSGSLEAMLPMMEVDSWLTGRRGVSLPFTDECAPIFSAVAAAEQLCQEAVSEGRIRRWKYIEYRGGDSFRSASSPSLAYLGHRLNLGVDEESLFARLEGSTKRAVRKAQNSALKIEISNELAAVRAFYCLFCGTRRRLGVPPQPFRFFANIHRLILDEGQGCVVLAKLGTVPIAGAIFFSHLKSAIYKFGASDARFLHFRGNNLVMWEAIKYYQRKGFEVLEFGRTSSTNKGLQKFKENWGATEYEIPYFRQNLRSNAFEPIADPAEGRTHLLGHLPMPAFKLVGSVFYRHMT